MNWLFLLFISWIILPSKGIEDKNLFDIFDIGLFKNGSELTESVPSFYPSLLLTISPTATSSILPSSMQIVPTPVITPNETVYAIL
jgi:hypothetical protein